MDFILIGKIVNTHALKGEVRIISDFQYKNLVFVVNNNLYIGENKEKLIIKTYRRHKNFDMITFEGINDILEVQKYKGKNIYVNKNEINLEGKILDNDLINLEVYFNDKLLGIVNEIINNNGYKVFNINDLLIPYNDNFIKNIDFEEKRIDLKNVEELIK